MQLVNKHRRLWMNACSEAIFPHEEVKKQVDIQYKVLYDAYDSYYETVIEPLEASNNPIIYSLSRRNPGWIQFTLYSSEFNPQQYINTVVRVTPYTSQGEYADTGFARIERTNRYGDREGAQWVFSNDQQPKKQGYLGNKTNTDLQLYLTKEQADVFVAAQQQIEQLKELHDNNMKRIASILGSCSTHKQLLEKAPGIYMNMPKEIKQLHDNAAQRKIKAQAKPAVQAKTEVTDDPPEVDVPEELDSALAVAAFIKQ